MKTAKTSLAGLIGAALSAALALPAAAQEDYPSRPITMLVAYPAGQGTDLAARYFAEQLTEALGQSVIVENRPGSAGVIGTAFAARAEGDGYTILMGASGTHAMNPFLYENVGYEALEDFEPIAATVIIPMAISANKELGVTSIEELQAAAKANPDAIDVALPSVTAQLVLELLKAKDFPLNGINYGGAADAQAAVLGNQVSLLIDTLSSSSRQFGRLAPIAVTSPAATESRPELKSVAEQGVEGFNVTAWNALYALKGTPPEIRDRLETEMKAILAEPETKEAMQGFGFEMAPEMSRAELEEWLTAEYNKYKEAIAAAGLAVN